MGTLSEVLTKPHPSNASILKSHKKNIRTIQDSNMVSGKNCTLPKGSGLKITVIHTSASMAKSYLLNVDNDI